MSGYLPIATRAYTEQAKPQARSGVKRRRWAGSWRPPERVFVFDCETETHAGQPLSFGSYRYCRLDRQGRVVLHEEGLFHADELPDGDPDGYATLAAYAARHGLRLWSRREFVDKVFWRCAYRARAWVVGFNLPFDLTRLAVGFGAGRGAYAGGHSLVIWDYLTPDGQCVEDRYRPRVTIKSIDSKRAFIGFSQRRDPDRDDLIPEDSPDGQPDSAYRFRGHFLDLRTLAFALTNTGYTLARACQVFGVTEGKQHTETHGQITPDYIDYNRQDVRATAGLFEALLAEYRRHPIALSPTKAYSPAAIAKAYLKAMGIETRLQRQPAFPRELLGAAMVAYYGGRAECRIRSVHVPVVYVDFLSMYPTVNTLMGLWRYITADGIEPRDTTHETRRLLERVTVEDCFEQAFWPQLLTLVQVEPNEDVLPTRADYGENGQWQIGVNPLRSDVPLWYALPDVIAAKLLSGKAPRIVKAISFDPIGEQEWLRPLRLGGEIEIDPATNDFFATLIEQRRRVMRSSGLDPAERKRLREFLKVLANSGCYGIFAEINREELGSRRREITIYGLDQPFTQKLTTVETPGEYSFPPLAACITAAARLMLALLERLVTDADGAYAFCDTDSMAIIATPTGGPITCPGGPLTSEEGHPAIKSLLFAEIDAIIDRFAALNPYDPDLVKGSILELEEWNLDAENGERRQLYCYAISAKRYALYNLDATGAPVIRKPSEHGLGHLLNPIDPDADNRDLAEEVWRQIVEDVLRGG